MTIPNTGETDTIINVENLIGTLYNDFLVGSDVNNKLEALSGILILIYQKGDDRLVGLLGNDTLDGGLGNDWVDYSYST